MCSLGIELLFSTRFSFWGGGIKLLNRGAKKKKVNLNRSARYVPSIVGMLFGFIFVYLDRGIFIGFLCEV